jgi:hypothetical protein
MCFVIVVLSSSCSQMRTAARVTKRRPTARTTSQTTFCDSSFNRIRGLPIGEHASPWVWVCRSPWRWRSSTTTSRPASTLLRALLATRAEKTRALSSYASCHLRPSASTCITWSNAWECGCAAHRTTSTAAASPNAQGPTEMEHWSITTRTWRESSTREYSRR